MFIKTESPSTAPGEKLSFSLYRDGVERISSNLRALFEEVERMGLISPWEFSETCKKTGLEHGNNDIRNCSYVIFWFCGLIYLHAQTLLRESLLGPLLEADDYDEELSREKESELSAMEEKLFTDAFVEWWRRLGLDWFLGKIKFRQFIVAYQDSSAKMLYAKKLHEREAAFLNEKTLERETNFNRCAIEYLCHPIHFTVFGLIEGFVSEIAENYKSQMNDLNIFESKLKLK